MKIFKKWFAVVIMLVCVLTPVFSGCKFFEIDSGVDGRKLNARTLEVFYDSKCLSWNFYDDVAGGDGCDDYANSFAIYCNNKLVAEVSNGTHFYEFADLLTEVKKYEFYVVANSGKSYIKNSDPSNIVAYDNSRVVVANNNPIDFVLDGAKLGVKTSLNLITVDTTNAPENISNFLLYLKSNSTGLNVYAISKDGVLDNKLSIILDPKTYDLQDEIYTIRLGYAIGGVNYISSDITYYNPDTFTGFTDKIYTFDGGVYDYYINTLTEFKTFIYYSFIYRLTDYNIKLADEVIEIAQTYGNDMLADDLDCLIVYECFANVYETKSFTFADENNLGNGYGCFAKAVSAADKIYNIKISYFDYKQCIENFKVNTNYILPQETGEGYWQQVDYQTRAELHGDNYDEFVSDKQFEYTYVTTSEELYWAVENKVTPMFLYKTDANRAYTIYNNAKLVLNRIISDEMTDYEKVLSIFDWICLNTQYDHYSLEIAGNDLMKLPCFYLEGVFSNGYAVCDGFSKAFSLMCNMLGIDAMRIVGDAYRNGSSGGHAWNKVLLDKDPLDEIAPNYYLVDITWTEISCLYNTEELAHKYFLLSDEEVKNSHFQFTGRTRYNDYASLESYYYYDNHKFTHSGQTYNLVIDSVEEIAPLFECIMYNDIDNIEFVVDLDLMVEEYEKVNGMYISALDFCKISQTNYVVYYYQLRNFFVRNIFKEHKIDYQYLTYNFNEDSIVYNEQGDEGLIFVFKQNILIDTSSDLEDFIKDCNDNQIEGTYTLYVDTSLLPVGVMSAKSKLLKLLEPSLKNTNVVIECISVDAINYSYDNGFYADVFVINVSYND